MSQELLDILKQGDEERLFTYLKSLSKEEKKKLVPSIKKIAKDFHHFALITNDTYGYPNSTQEQRDLLQYVNFVCFNKEDFKRTGFAYWGLERERLIKIIDWYSPEWLSDYINEQANEDHITSVLYYAWAMELTDKGCLQPSKELIAKLLPNLILEKSQTNEWHYASENILKRKITLEEHIWFLFEYDSDLHYCDRWLNFRDNEKNNGWLTLFKKLSDEAKIDRVRLLKASLLASNRNFNKVLSGWFCDLFMHLDPSQQELASMQTELFSVLSSIHSKPVNTVLKAIKKILNEPTFQVSAFLSMIPLLLASDTKATVLLVLGILEKIAAKHAPLQEQICALCSQAFINPDKEIQKAAVKIISKYGDANSELIQNSIQQTLESMLSAAREELKDFIRSSSPAITTDKTEKYVVDNNNQPAEIPFPASIDDLIFLASEAFDNNHPWHIDILPAAILKYRNEIKVEDLPRWEPAFQRALNLLTKGLRSNNGSLDYMLAFYFIDFGHWLFHIFKEEAKGLEVLFRKYDRTVEGRLESFMAKPGNSSYVAEWKSHKNIFHLKAFRDLLIFSNEKLIHKDSLSLLSIPTHVDGSIGAKVLIERMSAYQEQGQKNNSIDLQIAISRCSRDEEGIVFAKEKLKGEWRALMLFLLDETVEPKEAFTDQSVWVIAAMRRNTKKQWKQFEEFSCCAESFAHYIGQVEWKCGEEEYSSSDWDPNRKEWIKVKRTHKKLRVLKAKTIEKKESSFKKLVSGLIAKSEKTASSIFYDTIQITASHYERDYNDITRLLSLTPHHPSPLMEGIINSHLCDPNFFGEDSKKFCISVLQSFYTNWQYKGELENLFLATCMLCSDKTALSIAGEIWIKYAPAGRINNVRLGEMIGILEQIEFAPLKRFTDLVSMQLLKVSSVHNRLLQELIENILLQLPSNPIKSLKKLLEIYEELLSLNGQTSNTQIAEKINNWKGKKNKELNPPVKK